MRVSATYHDSELTQYYMYIEYYMNALPDKVLHLHKQTARTSLTYTQRMHAFTEQQQLAMAERTAAKASLPETNKCIS